MMHQEKVEIDTFSHLQWINCRLSDNLPVKEAAQTATFFQADFHE